MGLVHPRCEEAEPTQNKSRMNRELIVRKLNKILNIGHKHEEISDWLQCFDCMEAFTKYQEEKKLLQERYPKEFPPGPITKPMTAGVELKDVPEEVKEKIGRQIHDQAKKVRPPL